MKYYVHFVSFCDCVVDYNEFTTLEKGMDNALYWLQNLRYCLDRIEIFKANYESENYHRELIAVINA